MECPRCGNENRPAAKFCDGCGCRLPRLWPWPQVIIRPRADHGCARRKRRPTRQREIAAAIGIVLVGTAIVIGIVIGSPRWRAIIATWREMYAAWSAKVSPATGTLANLPIVSGGAAAVVESPVNQPVGIASAVGIQAHPVHPNGLESQEAAAVTTRSAAPKHARPGPIPPNSVPAQDQVMVNLLVAQLGQDLAWRTAQANAVSYAPDSPEFVYWHRVATAIRDGGTRPRH